MKLSEHHQIKALSHPLRVRILRILMKRRATVQQLADELEEASGRVHYHVKQLEKAGLISLVHEQEKLGVMEKYYQAVAPVFELDGMIGDVPTVVKSFLAIWKESETRIRDFLSVTKLEPEPDSTDLFLFTQPSLTEQQAQELVSQIQELLSKYDSDSEPGTKYNIVIVLHPILE